jgi:hypothetical protein
MITAGTKAAPLVRRGVLSNRLDPRKIFWKDFLDRILKIVFLGIFSIWPGWAYHLTKKVPRAATTPIATAFKICISHRKNGLLNRLPTEVSFPIFD